MPLLVFIAPTLLIVILIKVFEWQSKKSRKRNPLTSDLLRGPGEALREKINDLHSDLLTYMQLMYLLPLMIFSMAISQQLYGKSPSYFLWFTYAVIALSCMVYIVLKLLRIRKQLHQYALGLDAEIAVGQELNSLMRDGFWVFHDFPANAFNIDHVVIGPTGVFAIETKGRPKLINKSGASECEVIYDGTSLGFPTWKEHKPIEQAKSQAKWLEKWLSSAVGEAITVYPVLALPGWYIKRGKSGGIPVINGKNPAGFFLKYSNSNLSEKLQRQIVHNVEQRCRTVLPKAYSQPK